MTVRILRGDVRDRLRDLPDESVHCVVTSPPYWGLRDYGVEGQLGLEPTPEAFVATMVDVFRDVRRVLRADGTAWVNMGDSYAGGGRGGDTGSVTLQGSRQGQEESRKGVRAMTESRRRDNEPIPRSDVKVLGLKSKDLVGIPWRLAFALQADGWYLRQDIIWHKPNPMPESVRDRCTKAHEYIFLLSRSERYYYDQDAILEPVSPNTHARLSQDVQSQLGSDRVPGKSNGNMKAVGRKASSYRPSGWAESDKGEKLGRYPRPKNNESFDSAMAIMPDERNKRSVWTVTTQPFKEAHFATFPPALIEPCILAGCPVGGTVLDPFGGAGTTGLVADRLQRDAILIELNPEYADMAERRIRGDSPLFAQVGT